MVHAGINVEIVSKIAPARVFGAFADSPTLLPKIAPMVIKSVNLLEGEGGVGTVVEYSYTEALPFSYAKERIDVLDKENLEYEYTVIEGAEMGKKYDSASYRLKVVPSADGGCIVKVSNVYNLIPGVEYTDEEVSKKKEQFLGMLKAFEGYLLANPSTYA